MKLAKEIAEEIADEVAETSLDSFGTSCAYSFPRLTIEMAITKKLEPVREALVGLYGHTKNNHCICGLNYAAEQAIAMLEGEE